MTFPQTILAIDVELQLDGVWTDISSYAYGRDGGGITITRGRANESGTVEAGRCSLQLDNRDGRFSPRNPTGPYYGLIGRNTPIRVSAHGGERYLGITSTATSQATTPDVAALDITGDIDLRIEVSLDNWNASDEIDLMGKYRTTGEQRSWSMWLTGSNAIALRWSPDGTFTNAITVVSTEDANVLPRNRLALRATLDVNNGAGSNVVTFYTAPSIDGTWEQLGDPVVTSGTTSIFNSTAPVEIGDVINMGLANGVGRYYKAEIRNGIGGTAVANPDFTVQTEGATSFTDAAGRTWTVDADASISAKKIRFTGEVSEWPARWDTGGQDVYVPIEAAGVLRRLGQGSSPLDSTLRRRIPTFSPIAYWPMEDEASATQAASPIAGVLPMQCTALTFAADDSLGGSKALPSVTGGTTALKGIVPASSSSSWHCEFVYYLPTAPGGATTLLRYASTGTVGYWSVRLQSGTATLLLQDADETTLSTNTVAITDSSYFGTWARIQVYANQSGGTVNWALNLITVGGGSTITTGSYAGTVGRITTVQSSSAVFAAALDGMRIGHIAVLPTAGTTIYDEADGGFNGETAINRLGRIGAEESLTLTTYDGDTTNDSESMGPQRPNSVLDLLREPEASDGGILWEQRAAVGLAYRDRSSLHNQPPALTISYSGGDGLVVPLDPTDDDQAVINDETIQRIGGSSARATLDTGTLSTQAPPAGVGRYADSRSLSLYDDDQPAQIAWWLLHLGTWDEARYPTVKILLQNAVHQIDDALSVDTGDILRLTDLPAWLPPDDVDLMAQGSTEFLSQYQWEITYNCTPGAPWNVGFVDDAVYARADTDGCELVEDLTSSETGVDVYTTAGALWVTTAADSSSFPFDVRVGGEVMTVTGITGAVEDTFTRSVSSGWGSADTGQAWTVSGGSASDYNVGGGTATASAGAVNSSRFTTLGAISLADVDVYCDISVPAVATGATISTGLRLRSADTSNYYYVEVIWGLSGVLQLQLVSRVAAVSTTIAGPFTVGTYSASDTWRVRGEVVGTTLRAKLWKPSAVPEPQAWLLSTTTSTLTAAGPVGTRLILSTGNTNTLPLPATFDNFRIANPQTLTVTRSVNGVVKVQSTGADVRLAHPTIISR